MPREYRDNKAALVQRRQRLAERVAALEAEAEAQELHLLTDKQRDGLDALRRELEPADDSVAALVAAEEAAERYQAWVAEAIDLATTLEKHETSLLPSWRVVATWTIYFLVGLIVIPAVIFAFFDALYGP